MLDSLSKNRSIATTLALLAAALLGPVFHWAGLWLRGISFFYIPFPRLVLVYLFIALCALAAAWLILRPWNRLVRWLAVGGLLLNLGSLAYAGRLWRADSRLLTNDIVWTPFNADKLGIVIAPVDSSALSLAEARVVEETIRRMTASTELSKAIEIRQVPVVSSAEQVQQLARRMHASVVIWGTAQGSELVHTEHYVVSLGASAATSDMDTTRVMLLLASISTLQIADNRLTSENAVPPTAQNVLAPVALGFVALAADQPMLAAAFFQTALNARNLPAEALEVITSYYSLAFLLVDRPDLAKSALVSLPQPASRAETQIVLGTLALSQNDYAAAEEAFLHARALDPRCAQAYCGLGIIASEQHQLDRADDLNAQAISLEPEWGLIHLLRARTAELRGDVRAAQTAYELASSKIYPFHLLTARIAQRSRELAEAAPTPVATATIAATPSPMPIPGLRYHTVTRNETLRQIASDYGVSEEDIITLNKLENRNVLYIGQVLIIPEE